PAPFEGDAPGETSFGRPYQGDAVYLRDPFAAETQGAPECPALSVRKLLKLACLFECFGLPDHAAELIRGTSDTLVSMCDPNELLNILANEVDPSIDSYAAYLDRFKSDPKTYYRSKRQ